MSLKTEICYIHKIAVQEVVHEEPIPFAGILKFVEYKCPMCQSTFKSIRDYTTE